jgi:hypothetical protein
VGAARLKVGQMLGVRPECEGPAPVLTAQGVEVFCFQSGLTESEVRGFAHGAVLCGLYVDQAIPVLVLDVEGFGGLEVAFCVFTEPQDKRAAFFASDPALHTAHLVLCDFPEAVVRAVRAIHPGPAVMLRIRQALLDQAAAHQDINQCFSAMSDIYERLGPGDLRGLALMRPA